MTIEPDPAALLAGPLGTATQDEVDLMIRGSALAAAAQCWTGMPAIYRRDAAIVETARQFEAYLRGGQA